MADAPVLCAAGLGVRRGGRDLCRELALEVRPGEALELVGPNGCGKTTVLRVLAGLLEPDAGEVRWGGRPLAAAPASYRAVMAFVGHRDGVTPALTAAANLECAAALGAGGGDVGSALARLGLQRRAGALAGELSAGEARRLGLARLLLRPARLWLLDEPLANLDAAGRATAHGLVGAHLGNGGLAVITGHAAGGWPGTVTRHDLGAH